MLAITEDFHAIWRCGVLMHFAENGFQGFNHRLLTVEVQRTHFVPRVAIQQVNATHQAILILAKAEDVQLTEIKMHHLIAERSCRVIFQVNDNRQMANLTWAVERFWRRCRQAQREMVRHVGDHLLQLRQIDNAVAFNIQAGARGQQAVKPCPRHQFIQVTVIFQRLMADDRLNIWRAVIQIPT